MQFLGCDTHRVVKLVTLTGTELDHFRGLTISIGSYYMRVSCNVGYEQITGTQVAITNHSNRNHDIPTKKHSSGITRGSLSMLTPLPITGGLAVKECFLVEMAGIGPASYCAATNLLRAFSCEFKVRGDG